MLNKVKFKTNLQYMFLSTCVIFSHKVVNLNLIRDNGKDLDQERAFVKDASVVY